MRLSPLGSEFILRKRHANPTEYNSSLSYYLQFGAPADAKLRNTAALIHHIMREPLFTTLRTKEQLGSVRSLPTCPRTALICVHPSTPARHPMLHPVFLRFQY